MTQVFENPPAELEMELELKKIQERYASLASSPDAEVIEGTGIHAQGVGGTSTAAYVSLYAAKDGTVSTVTTDAARKKVTSGNFLLRPDPKYQYRRDRVTGRPVKVSETALLCRLHPDSADREWLDSIGLAGRECTKDNIPSQFMLLQHMDKKHHQEWLSIQREESERKEQESRDLIRMQAEAMAKMAGGGSMTRQTFDCDECERFFDSAQGLTLHKSRDHKE